MDADKFLSELDQLFNTGRVDEVEGFLEQGLEQAKAEKDDQAQLMILNELIGFLRDKSKYDKALAYGAEAVEKFQKLEMTDNIGYATTLLNVATACRAAGHLEASRKYFEAVLPIYERHLPPDDYLVASYYNNLSLLYQEMNRHDKACECLERALAIIEKKEKAENEIATTHANLGISKIRVLETDEGIRHLQTAIRMFESMDDKGYHYSAALSGMGEAMYSKGDYEASISYYTQASEAIKGSYGENQAYKIMLENIQEVKEEQEKHRKQGECQDEKKQEASPEQEENKDVYITKIVAEEWAFFDKVENEGGRASCQDNFPVFEIMRKSQYLTWPETLLKSYLDDVEMAKSVGENLITYKYGYMMESTSPEKFAKLKDKLPPVEPERRALIEQIVAIQVGWMEDFAENYPRMSGLARNIHTSQDTEWDTSAETYLRGELMTYSDRTLKQYGQFVAGLAKEGKNLTAMTMEHTAHLYGYESLEDAESKL